MSALGTLPKQIPKKPPPPAPIGEPTNGTNSDQAPALPPKPSNQFSPHQHQLPRTMSPSQQHHSAMSLANSQQSVREQARVIYAYEPRNDDELSMEVNDIINIIDKHTEDLGWWKGELRGKIGVFPDNFVQLIEPVETATGMSLGYRAPNPNRSMTGIMPPTASLPPAAAAPQTDGRFKPLFPLSKGPTNKSNEQNNWETRSSIDETSNDKHASLISLRREKLLQSSDAISSKPMMQSQISKTKEGLFGNDSSPETTNGNKLKHITANRSKGPPRRPPSSIQNKRNKSDTNGDLEDNRSLDSLQATSAVSFQQPIGNNTNVESTSAAKAFNHDSLPVAHQTAPLASNFANPRPNNGVSTATSVVNNNPIKPSLSMDNVVETPNLTPKTSQRSNQVPQIKKDSITPATTPPWMVELKKAHAEKKRDSPVVAITPNLTSPQGDEQSPKRDPVAISNKTSPERQTEVKKEHSTGSSSNLSIAQYDSLVKEVTSEVTKGFEAMRDEIKELREKVQVIDELRNTIEVMKAELKVCQSATENQKRYIKELVTNLADERKKIASMQTELDRTLK